MNIAKQVRGKLEVADFDGPPKQVLVRMPAATWDKLHGRAALNKRSLNLEINATLLQGLDGSTLQRSTNNEVTGTEIARWRKDNGLTQLTLGAKMQVPAETICRWERGVHKISAPYQDRFRSIQQSYNP